VSYPFDETFLFQENWKASETDASYLVLSTSGDHVFPITRGGSNDPSNLVTACSICNYMKGNYLLEEIRYWKLVPSVSTSWRGLTEYLEPMMERAGLQKSSYFLRWVGAIRKPESLEP
jgi:HNH endonuclease